MKDALTTEKRPGRGLLPQDSSSNAQVLMYEEVQASQQTAPLQPGHTMPCQGCRHLLAPPPHPLCVILLSFSSPSWQSALEVVFQVHTELTAFFSGNKQQPLLQQQQNTMHSYLCVLRNRKCEITEGLKRRSRLYSGGKLDEMQRPVSDCIRNFFLNRDSTLWIESASPSLPVARERKKVSQQL